jgi:excisionase family DNA binding protein
MEPKTSDDRNLRPYTVAEYADLARLSPNAVYQMVARNDLPAVRFGRAIRIPREAGNRVLRGDAA